MDAIKSNIGHSVSRYQITDERKRYRANKSRGLKFKQKKIIKITFSLHVFIWTPKC